MYPECPTEDWWGKPCWLNPRDSNPDVVQGWSNCISDLAYSRRGVKQAELSEIAVDREVFQVLLWMLPLQPSLEENRRENE